MMVAPLYTALTGTIPRSVVVKYEDKFRKFTGIQANVMIRSRFPLALTKAAHNFEIPVLPESSFVSPCDVCQLDDKSIFNIKAKVVDVSAVDIIGGDKGIAKRVLQVEAADYDFQVTLIGNAASQFIGKESYAFMGLVLNSYLGKFDAQSTKLAWFLPVSASAEESRSCDDSPIRRL